ncbi:MAG TPA: acyl carrier protein [Chloroflexia bacterium]|nr:acyl carrier protein [Chloroflexia bacterium]
MANATEHLREVAVQQYGVDEAEVANKDANALTELLLGKIAMDKYKVSASELEGLDRRGETQLLLQNMVSDLLKVDKSKVSPETTFSDLGADSLDMVELLMTIEDVCEPFGEMKIPEEDANIGTVGEAVDRIDSYITNYVSAS